MTLAGESAGASSVNSFAYAYPERPLVRAFIMQSGFIEMMGDQGTGPFLRVAAGVGCTGPSDEEIVACMKKADAMAIRKAISNDSLNAYATDSGGGPGVDNVTVWPIRELVERGMAGKFAKLVSYVHPILLNLSVNRVKPPGDGKEYLPVPFLSLVILPSFLGIYFNRNNIKHLDPNEERTH